MNKKEFLQSTIDYYSADINRRCKTRNGICTYSPEAAGKVGISEGCAIGRMMTPENKLLADFECGKPILSIYNRLEQNKMLPDWMLEFEPEFLSNIQSLHDQDCYWNFNGISKRKIFYKFHMYKISN